MSDYNRYTTQKGQLLLNIKPPSRTNASNYIGAATTTNPILAESKYISYTPQNRGYVSPNNNQTYAAPTASRQIYTQGGVQQSPSGRQVYIQRYDPSAMPNRNLNTIQQHSNNYTQIDSRSRTNVVPNQPIYNTRFKQPVVVPYQDNAYTNAQRNYQQKPFQQSLKNKNQHRGGDNYDQLGEDDSNNSEKRGEDRNIDATICCFPGYWLLMLLLGVVIAAFFLILLKQNRLKAANAQANTNPSLNPNGNTVNISPGDETSYQFAPSQLPSDAAPKQDPNPKTSETSFMLPIPTHHQNQQKSAHDKQPSPWHSQKHFRHYFLAQFA